MGYNLFLHRNILKSRERKPVNNLRLIKSKLVITDELIAQTRVQTNFKDIGSLRREQLYSNRLKLAQLCIETKKISKKIANRAERKGSMPQAKKA